MSSSIICSSLDRNTAAGTFPDVFWRALLKTSKKLGGNWTRRRYCNSTPSFSDYTTELPLKPDGGNHAKRPAHIHRLPRVGRELDWTTVEIWLTDPLASTVCSSLRTSSGLTPRRTTPLVPIDGTSSGLVSYSSPLATTAQIHARHDETSGCWWTAETAGGHAKASRRSTAQASSNTISRSNELGVRGRSPPDSECRW